MPKHRSIRLILAGVVFTVFFLPTNPPSETTPNWLLILWSSWEALPRILGGTGIANRIGWVRILLFWWAVPLLFLFNVCLSVCPFGALRTLYRVFILILLPLTWHGAFQADPGWRGMGFWAHITVVSVAALVEIVFLIGERLRKPQNVDLAVE